MNKKLKKLVKKNNLLFETLRKIINYNSNRRSKYYERFLENVIDGKVVIKINNIPGEYEIDPRSHVLKQILLAKKKEYEPHIVELILNNIDTNKDAINIGANIGLYSNLLADSISSESKVLAIEPTPRAFKMLKNNIKRNHNENKVFFFNGIAANMIGSYNINIIKGKEEYSSLGQLVHPSIKNEEFKSLKVKGTTIDNLVKKHKLKPGLIVMDVEGAELNVLRGATESLKKYNPIIITELDDKLLSKQNSNSKEVIDFLSTFNYEIIDVKNGSPIYPFKGNIIAKI